MLWLCLSVVTAIELQCEFKTMESNENFYACDVKDPRVDSSRTIVTSIKGDHLDGRKNSDVNSFRVYHSSLLRAIPQGLENFFPNLTMISVVKTRLSSITQSTLKPLTELTVLDLTMNKIRVLESGLFKFNTKLTDVYFGNNPLNAIAGDILEPLVSLKVADFSNNLCINMANFDDRHSLEDIRKEIVAKCQNEAKVSVFFISFERKITEILTFREPTFLLDVDCASTTSGTSHDTNNTPVQSVKFPFLVALVAATDSRFICGGSLITAKHVLSAAHCVHPLNGAPLPVDDIILHFGLASSSDDGLLKRNVAEIFFHHSWTGGQQEADLAILLADQPVELSEKIKPVCMMHSPIYFQPSNGTVVNFYKQSNYQTLKKFSLLGWFGEFREEV